MRVRNSIVVIAGLLAASRLHNDYLVSLHTSNICGSSLLGWSPNENLNVVNSHSTIKEGWAQSAEGRKKIPLDILTDEQGQNVSCPPNTQPIFNNPLPSTNFSSNYKIPFVIHQTFKTRCVTDDFFQLTLAWKALGIPYYFHDDKAIERLVRLGYNEFPHLLLMWDQCITKPVVKTDLWRLLLLYEYGGIYADLDTKPESFQPNTTLRMDDEMYTVPDQSGLPAFHFMASMPRHPLTFITLHQSLYELLYMKDTGNYNPAMKTGPFAVKNAMGMFLHNQDSHENQMSQIRGDEFTFHGMGGHTLPRDVLHNQDSPEYQMYQIHGDEFTFHGMGGHTLRRDGSRATSHLIVKEFAVDNKAKRLQANNVTHYSMTEVASHESCFDVLTKYYEQMN